MRFTRWLTLALALLLGACASPISRVILLPQANGANSSVIVTTSYGSQILNTPYQRVSAQIDTSLQSDATSADQAQKQYPQLFAKLPPAPNKYILYFMPGGIELTPESRAVLPVILNDAGNRHGFDLVITGHTDTVGNLLDNDALSRSRAELVAKLLILSGAPQERVEAVGRGKRELLIKTSDNVDEPKNRRVEIVVR